jgi:hypothetical protein
MTQVLEKIGAGEGNRTLVISLEGFCSTIELHPQSLTPLMNFSSFLIFCRRSVGVNRSLVFGEVAVSDHIPMRRGGLVLASWIGLVIHFEGTPAAPLTRVNTMRFIIQHRDHRDR